MNCEPTTEVVKHRTRNVFGYENGHRSKVYYSACHAESRYYARNVFGGRDLFIRLQAIVF